MNDRMINDLICRLHSFFDRRNGAAQMALDYARSFGAFEMLRKGEPHHVVGFALKSALASPYHYHLLGTPEQIGRAFELFVAELVLEIADV